MIAANWTAWVSSQEWCAGGVDLIPAAPRALSDVFSLADEQDVDVRRLIAIVSGDPMFTVRVLRLANVAAFAAAGEVTSVQVAVVRLGVRTVRQAVLAACFSALAHSINTYGSRCADELQHAVGTACLARRLAQQLRLPGDDAFVQALLHDVGKLVLLKLRFEFRRLGGPAPSSEEFEEVLTAHHADVGATALQIWGLPEPVREPVRWHHSPLSAGEYSQAAALLYIANGLSHRYGFGRRPDDDAEPLDAEPAAMALGLEDGWLVELDQEALSLGVSARHLVE
jgi:putative nucleotidyltransferase with HDIG domain